MTATVGRHSTRTTRILGLDVLRGIAILGTLGTNIWIFTNPEGLVGYLEGRNLASGAWDWAQRVLEQLAQGKFLGLLTIMFGVGLAIQQQSATKRGQPWPGRYPWRAALLFLDGLVHFVLVVEFDVLMGYAVTGLVVAFVLATSERAQRRWLVVTASIHVAMLTVITVAILAAGNSSGTPSTPPAPMADNPYADGSWWDLVVFRLAHAGLFRLEAVFIFAMSIALFLTGARLFRAGVFTAAGAPLRKRLMLAGFGIAAPIDLALGIFAGGPWIVLTRYGTAPFVAMGLLALVAEYYVRRGTIGVAGRRLADVGRMALSCYVLQNIVASVLCYGWGFGLAATVSPAGRVPFTVAVYLLTCAIVLLAANLWLRRFERGPVEWLWNASFQRLAAVSAERHVGSNCSAERHVGSNCSTERRVGSNCSAERHVGSNCSTERRVGSNCSAERHVGSNCSTERRVGSNCSAERDVRLKPPAVDRNQ